MIHYRPAQPDDLHAIERVESVCFTPPVRFTRDFIEELFERDTTWLAVDGDTLCGFIMAGLHEQHIGYVDTLDVLPSHRRRGIARELLQRVQDSLQAQGCDVMALHAAANNPNAIALYEVCGYKAVETVPQHFPDGSDGILFLKTLR